MLIDVFVFKHKTAYDMRISDWSSDVCSSDLLTADNPRQRQPITELKALYRKRGEELARPANLATYKRQWAAFHAFDEESSTSTGTQMRRVLQRIGEEERDRLSARRDHANSMTDWSNLLDSALAALGVMMIAAAGLLGWTAVRAVAARRATERERLNSSH